MCFRRLLLIFFTFLLFGLKSDEIPIKLLINASLRARCQRFRYSSPTTPPSPIETTMIKACCVAGQTIGGGGGVSII